MRTKKTFLLFISVFLCNLLLGQDFSTLVKLNELSVALGISNNKSVDTTFYIEKQKTIDRKLAKQLLLLLQAAECYSNKDYEKSGYYIRKVVINFKNADYNSLKNLVTIGSYANLKDIKKTAKYFYIINKSKKIGQENMLAMQEEIRNNFRKDDFENALASYYYYHKRLKVVDEIKFKQ